MAYGHHVLLLRFNISGFRIPPILLVCLVISLSKRKAKVAFFFCSMRYSRMLEESSFANKKADYFWLLFLSSVMLLVETHNSLSPVVQRSLTSILGTLTTIQPALPVILPCVRTDILVVATTSLHTNLAVRVNHNNCALSPRRTRRVLMGPQRHLESRCRRSSRVCSRPHWVVSP